MPKKTIKRTIKKIDKIPSEIVQVFEKDQSLHKEFQDFMEDKSKPPSQKELAVHGGSLSSTVGQYFGIYNPEKITIDTFLKMKQNPQLGAGLKIIKFPVIGQHWSAECEDKDIADFINQIMKPLWYNLISTSLTAIEFGFSAHEIVYGIDDINVKHRDQSETFYPQAILPKKFKSLYPSTVVIKLDEKENFNGLIQNFGGKSDIVIPQNKSFVFTNDKGESFGNLYGTSRLVACYDVWYWWVSTVTFMLRYFERKGTPPVIVRFPSGKTKDGQNHSDIAFQLGKALLSESVVAMTSSTYADSKEKKWDINYLLDDKRGDMFINVLTNLEAKMLRGMFVPERVFTQDTTSKAGSYALSKVHADMFMLGEEALIVDLENQINKYVISRLVDYNFGTKAPECYIRIERITDARKAFLKEVFMEMLKAGTAIPAVKEIAEVVGVPISDDNTENEVDKEGVTKTPMTPERGHKGDKGDNKDQTLSLSDDKIKRIEKYIDKRQEELKLEFKNEILDKQIQWVSEEIELTEKKNLPLKEFWFEDKKTVDWYGNEVPIKQVWQPLRSKLIKKLYDLMEELFLYGQKTAIGELNLNIEAKVTPEYKDIFKAKSIALGDRFLSNLRYETELLVLMPHNKTLSDILSEVRGRIKDKLYNVNVVEMVETETFSALNLGRKFIVSQNV